MMKRLIAIPALIGSFVLLTGCEEGVDKDDGTTETPQRSVGTTFDGDTAGLGNDPATHPDTARTLPGGTNDQTGPTGNGTSTTEDVPAY